MAQDQLVLRKIDWHEAFAFTRLFSGFRMALHSTKIVLALAGLLLTFAVGCVLDWVWVRAGQGAAPQEVAAYYAGSPELARQRQANAIAEIAARVGVMAEGRLVGPEWVERVGSRAAIRATRDQIYTAYPAGADPAARQSELARLKQLEPYGPFIALFNYEQGVLQNLILSAAQFRLFGGFDAGAVLPADQVFGQLRPGVLASAAMAGAGVLWLLSEHWFYSLLFVPIALAIWAIAGGGICRAAVLQFARDEKISIREAVRFSLSKFWGFFLAPVICLLFILGIGLLLSLGGLLANIPYVGDILAGILWFLALLGGLAIAFIIIGMVAGGSLFAPVIASEGSDVFDAISRGFVYVYSRPWKSLLYGLTLLVYGSLCYLFLRLFVWLTLAATHVFVGLGVFRSASVDGMDRLNAAWQMPTFLDLQPRWIDYGLLSGSEVVLGVLIGLWTYLVWSLLQSWLISYYFSGSSMAYLLLRKDVDAIEIDEIYAEEGPEADQALPEAAAGAAGVASAPAQTVEQSQSAPASSEPPAGPTN